MTTFRVVDMYITGSTSGSPSTLTKVGHGLPIGVGVPIAFKAKSGLSDSPAITTTITRYYAKAITTSTFAVYTDNTLASPVSFATNASATATVSVGSFLLTGGGGGDTNPGFEITFGNSHSVGQSGFLAIDYQNAPILTVSDTTNGFTGVFGDYMSAYPYIFAAGIKIDGTRNPACILFPDGVTGSGSRMWSGSGAPGASTVGGAAAVGDIYIRIDTPTTSNQRLYQCTTAGTPGTWTARY